VDSSDCQAQTTSSVATACISAANRPGIATHPRELIFINPRDRELSPRGAAFLQLLDVVR